MTTRRPASTAPVVTLRKELTRSIKQGHPWLYRDAVAPEARAPGGRDPRDGDVVEVRGKRGDTLAWGFWDRQSPIALRVLTVGAAPPPESLVERRVNEALALRLARLDRARTNAFRWIHGEGDRLPGIHVDLYDDVAVVRFDGTGARAFYGAIAATGGPPPGRLELALHAAAARAGVPLRFVLDRDRRGDLGELEVIENGLRFGVALGRGSKGGLFLDQRDNRAAVGARARGRSVLNLFGYTGGFSVYAAAGGATRTDTVDIAGPAIEAARENFARNALSTDAAGFHAVDAFEFLAEATRRKLTWDVVISDPPSFAPNRRSLPAARRAYRRLHRLAAAVVAQGGLFCPASCSSHFERDEFLASVEAGVRDAGRDGRIESVTGAGFDHPVLPAFPEGDYLKFAFVPLD